MNKHNKKNIESEIIRHLKEAAAGSNGVTDAPYVSGQTICHALDLSRTAVWKHIKSLRKSGYDIKASTKKGYNLSPGSPCPFNAIELASGSNNKLIGRVVHFYDELGSTNLTAAELAASGAPEGTGVVADRQKNGKGRIGRQWHSPGGVNLYTSVILRPAIPPARGQALTLLSAVAVASTIGEFSTVRPTVKWPNDILIRGMKVAGILTEMSSEADRINHVIVGIGVNINMDMEKAPEEIQKIATAICKTSTTPEVSIVSRLDFTRTLYSNLEKWYKLFLNKGLDPIIEAWREWFNGEGEKIRIRLFDSVTTGTCLGINSEGALLVQNPAGKVVKIIAGDVEQDFKDNA